MHIDVLPLCGGTFMEAIEHIQVAPHQNCKMLSGRTFSLLKGNFTLKSVTSSKTTSQINAYRRPAPLWRNFHGGDRAYTSSTTTNSSQSNMNFLLLGGGTAAFAAIAAALCKDRVRAEEEQQDDDINSTDDASSAPDSQQKGLVEHRYKYVIIGGGTAGFAAAQEILKRDKNAEVLIISEDRFESYSRTPLSKELWKSEDPASYKFKNFMGEEENLFFSDEEKGRIKYLFRSSVVDLDPNRKGLLLSDDSVVWYEKCLIATGGDPRMLRGVPTDLYDKVTTYRTLSDFQKLDEVSKQGEHILVVGGGFLGSEIACSLAHRAKSSENGLKITQVFPESGIMGLNFPEYLSKYAMSRAQSETGIEMRPGRLTQEIEKGENGKVAVVLDNGEKLEVDHVVVSIGITPAVDVAVAAQLEIDQKNGGIVANAELETRSDLWVAGDVVSYYDRTLGRRRVEHHDHAVASGKTAGANMVGAREAYTHLPMFWGDVSTMGYEAVGNLDGKLKTVSVWEKPAEGDFDQNDFKRGIVYYLEKDKVVGVLLFGVFGRVDDARNVIKKGKTYKDASELRRLISLEEVHH
eukprot:TRINITY_DN3616_c0_g1_i2.p1 TRINITY_DN3616_c0_g1~~TRINITY_DN3616_c0_g1_i2.p1  ORF type:complete len:577 (-),score=144.16 TRINITY_DN3616_c0_g1_i2:157-1887(-)